MDIEFTNIDYLKNGNNKQRLAYAALTRYKIMADLKQFDPLLVGTIPISIDIEESDLDIICYFKESIEFKEHIIRRFSDFDCFSIKEKIGQELKTVIAKFRIDNFDVEIFGQNIPTRQQNAFRHMIIEHRFLCERDDAFRQTIIDLKRQGYKTEPAFGIVLGLTGNPYLELLNFEN
jgi:hypothetical protein